MQEAIQERIRNIVRTAPTFTEAKARIHASFGPNFDGLNIALEERGHAWVYGERPAPQAQEPADAAGLDRRAGALVATGIGLLVVTLFPPFAVSLPDGLVSNQGFAFILNPPKLGQLTAMVQVPLLGLEIVVVSVLGRLAWLWADK